MYYFDDIWLVMFVIEIKMKIASLEIEISQQKDWKKAKIPAKLAKKTKVDLTKNLTNNFLIKLVFIIIICLGEFVSAIKKNR